MSSTKICKHVKNYEYLFCQCICVLLAFGVLMLLVDRQEKHLVMCLERVADDLHIVHLMPLPPHRLLLH